MMEEELLKILNDRLYKVVCEYDREKLAKEIADHFRKSEEWLIFDMYKVFESGTDAEGNYEYFKDGEQVTLDEVYNYYCDNVLKKSQ